MRMSTTASSLKHRLVACDKGDRLNPDQDVEGMLLG
jgi:hypothetical protein